jgi:hypothetical protein
VWSQIDGVNTAREVRYLFAVSPGRTLTLEEQLYERAGYEPVRALLEGEPLVEQLSENGELTLDVVLDAYDAALKLATELIEAAREALQPTEDDTWLTGIGYDNRVILLAPREQLTPCGLLRESDAKAFDAALKLVKEMNGLPGPQAEYFVTRACSFAASLRLQSNQPPLDAELLRVWQQAAQGARTGAEDERRKQQKREAYEQARAAWIGAHGSRRLRLAQEREYRHDGLYRDERLAAELPGFRGDLGRKVEVKEIINPSEEALDLEQQVLETVAELKPAVKVRLVFLKIEPEFPFDPDIEGEFVEVSNYLGRYKAYRPVREEEQEQAEEE